MNNIEKVLTQDNTFKYQDERFADLQLLRYRVDGFETLSLRQQTLIWHLNEAALWGRDILWDQNGKYNLAIRHWLEHIYLHFSGERDTEEFKAFEVFLKRIWFSNGIHHHYATDKFLPEFSRDYLLYLHQETQNHVPFSTLNEENLSRLLDIIFDPALYPKRVNQAQGEDLLLTSACNYYEEGITQKEAEDFYNRQKEEFLQKADAADVNRPIMFGMNSQLVRNSDGTVRERSCSH